MLLPILDETIVCLLHVMKYLPLEAGIMAEATSCPNTPCITVLFSSIFETSALVIWDLPL